MNKINKNLLIKFNQAYIKTCKLYLYYYFSDLT